MYQIETFQSNEFGNVRIIQENRKVLFCGKNVASALGYKDTKKLFLFIVGEGAKRPLPHPQSRTKQIEMEAR